MVYPSDIRLRDFLRKIGSASLIKFPIEVDRASPTEIRYPELRSRATARHLVKVSPQLHSFFNLVTK